MLIYFVEIANVVALALAHQWSATVTSRYYAYFKKPQTMNKQMYAFSCTNL